MIDIKTRLSGRFLLKKESIVLMHENKAEDGKLEVTIYLSSGAKVVYDGGIDDLIEFTGDELVDDQKSDEPKLALFESISKRDADMLFSIVNKSIEISIRAMRSEFFQLLRDAR